MSYHIAFRPEDTGKHLTATIIARVLQKLGIVKKKKFIHCRNTSLKKFVTLVEAAEGGVIFVDEAHLLLPDEDKKDDIAMLEKILKDNNVIVFMSGEQDKMEAFMSKYRVVDTLVPYKYQFECPSIAELTEIFGMMCHSSNEIVEENAMKVVAACFKNIPESQRASQNARICSSLLQHTQMQRDARVHSLSAKDKLELLNILLIEDLKRAMFELKFKIEVGDERTVDEIFEEECKKIIGLQPVKDAMKKMIETSKMAKLKETLHGTAKSKEKLHMIFSGPAGTGTL
jgi:DNA polymerase III delta prime subunit